MCFYWILQFPPIILKQASGSKPLIMCASVCSAQPMQGVPCSVACFSRDRFEADRNPIMEDEWWMEGNDSQLDLTRAKKVIVL